MRFRHAVAGRAEHARGVIEKLFGFAIVHAANRAARQAEEAAREQAKEAARTGDRTDLAALRRRSSSTATSSASIRSACRAST